ncbi:NUDIX domain-containing protein [Corynebacterium pseudotuberculosis]|uniref:NUDIX domain-containing protein n=2 Tax=Corynebacterium pseudotuberculosis TaxID=1719 RepID=D9QCK0_CORP2|nr:NUDIX domain-containing protein [Corynebacterium pseudotuberculosis FRC41]ADL11276.1 NUDIX domain-containing protein [Corynebacterium pseudotuberculosis C231]ADL21692.2 NUDIX domain-containing protein [Corynebacterium pseudotuberculosis 1002]ADO27087.3 NUDIX domain-containing protein [Corynebacterium pseudotuberculosis I19]AEX40329.1 7,8-dihydro-8-oxoguanine-triphosphatase [Corynebacterium pseudotuberculosis 3/99-5]AIG06039.1 mutT3 [Corynebacterium pseudotuberculosis]
MSPTVNLISVTDDTDVADVVIYPRIIPAARVEHMPTTSGDGWVEGPNGTQLWGKYGAAGLLLTAARTQSVLMQHRASWTNYGGTWALPGGARELVETAEEAAAREAYEETGISLERYVFVQSLVTAGPYHSGWTYTTVLALTQEELDTVPNAESEELRWVPISEVHKLDLLPAFAATWDNLKTRVEKMIGEM